MGKMMLRRNVKPRLLRLSMLAILIAACAKTTQPSPMPAGVSATWTIEAPTVVNTSTSQPQPFTTTTPIIVIEGPASAMTSTPIPLPVPVPSEKVAIFRPGPGSSVTSPFRVRGWAGPSWNGRVEINLIGEDGRLITSSVAYLLAIPGNAGLFTSEVEFETPLVAEAARLEVSIFGIDDRELDHMASVDVILLSIGSPLVHETIHSPEKLHIYYPETFDTIRGGITQVRGIGWLDTEGPLYIEVLDQDGNVVGATKAEIESEEGGATGAFTAEIQYQIDAPQRGRIAVYEPSDTIPGILHYASVFVNLRP
jgi:hypothetical protein